MKSFQNAKGPPEILVVPVASVRAGLVEGGSLWVVPCFVALNRENLRSQGELRLVFVRSSVGVRCFRIATVGSGVDARPEYGVKNNVEHIVEHPGQEPPQQVVRLLQARIGVDLDQYGVQILIQDEVVAKQLESMFLESNLSLDCFHGINYYVIDVLEIPVLEGLLRLALTS